MNSNLLNEVETISTEFRKVYSLAKERAENHANEGWSHSNTSKLQLENKELKEHILQTKEEQTILYESLEKKLEEHDDHRREEVMNALNTAHDVKAAHVNRLHELEKQLLRKDRTMKKLNTIATRVNMSIDDLLNKIATAL